MWPAQKRRINSFADMVTLAAELLADSKGGDYFLLLGDLGAGKTTFVQALSSLLGIKDQITSPTFTIVSEYGLSPAVVRRTGITKLVHVDLYRLDRSAVASDPAVQDALSQADNNALVVIEWADRLGARVISGRRLFFSHSDEPTERIVNIEG